MNKQKIILLGIKNANAYIMPRYKQRIASNNHTKILLAIALRYHVNKHKACQRKAKDCDKISHKVKIITYPESLYPCTFPRKNDLID
jgi:hypothetical protein